MKDPRDRIREAFENPALITRALREGVRQAVREHIREGMPMVDWRDGKVVWVPPEELPDPDDESLWTDAPW